MNKKYLFLIIVILFLILVISFLKNKLTGKDFINSEQYETRLNVKNGKWLWDLEKFNREDLILELSVFKMTSNILIEMRPIIKKEYCSLQITDKTIGMSDRYLLLKEISNTELTRYKNDHIQPLYLDIYVKNLRLLSIKLFLRENEGETNLYKLPEPLVKLLKYYIPSYYFD